MSTKIVLDQSLLNDPSGADVATSGGVVTITGLSQFREADIVEISEIVYNAEVQQEYVLGADNADIVASTEYAIKIGGLSSEREGAKRQALKFGYTSAANLSGDADKDRSNVFSGLASRINAGQARGSVFATATLLSRLDGPITVATFSVGETVTGGTSGATAKVEAAGADYILVSNIAGGPFEPTGEAITGGTSTAVITTTASEVADQAMLIVDDAGYYPARPDARGGANAVLRVSGFSATDSLVLNVAAERSSGEGARLAEDSAILNSTDSNLARGEHGVPSGFVAGNTYSIFSVHLRTKGNDNVNSGLLGLKDVYKTVYAYDQAAGFGAFQTAILALNP